MENCINYLPWYDNQSFKMSIDIHFIYLFFFIYRKRMANKINRRKFKVHVWIISQKLFHHKIFGEWFKLNIWWFFIFLRIDNRMSNRHLKNSKRVVLCSMLQFYMSAHWWCKLFIKWFHFIKQSLLVLLTENMMTT